MTEPSVTPEFHPGPGALFVLVNAPALGGYGTELRHFMRNLFTLSCFLLFHHLLAQGTWNQLADHPGGQRYAQAAFSINGKGYVCTGFNGSQNTAALWEYDPVTAIWTEKTPLPGGARQYASGFAIGDTGYVTCGWENVSDVEFNDLWAYHPASDSWEQKASMPGASRYASVAFSIGDTGYVGTGVSSPTWLNDFYAYDATTNTWTQKANFPGNARRWAVGFASEGKGYVGTGESSGTRYRDFYAYDPTNNTWQQRADLGTTNRRNAISFVINDAGYVGGGVDFVENYNDFHRYDVQSNTWVPVAPFPLSVRKNAASFSVADTAYVVGGNGQSPIIDDVWEFVPDFATAITGSESDATLAYPNPAHDAIRVTDTDTHSYRILSSTGQVQLADRPLGQRIDITALAPGSYVLELYGAAGVRRARIIKE